MQPPSSTYIPCWHSSLAWYPHGDAQGIYIWGKRRRQGRAPEGKDWLNGDHRATQTHSWWSSSPRAFLEVTKTKGPWPCHLYLLPYHGFGGGVKMSWRFSIGARCLWAWQGSSARRLRWLHHANEGSGLGLGCMCVLRLPGTLEYWCLDTKRNVELNPAFSLAQYWSLNRKRPNCKPETLYPWKHGA